MTTIGYLVGSISSTSVNREYAKALASLAPEGVRLVEIPLAELPFYSPDYDADFPLVAQEFKRAIADVDGVIIVTPEYSRSIPGVLKNALDWAARPWGQNSFDGKPVAVTGASIGSIGTAAAQQHLRGILGNLNAATLGQPETFVHATEGLLVDGQVTDPGLAEYLRGFLGAFTELIRRVHSSRAA